MSPFPVSRCCASPRRSYRLKTRPDWVGRAIAFFKDHARWLVAVSIHLLLGTHALCQRDAAQPALSLSSAIAEAIRTSPQAAAARFDRDASLARTEKDRPVAKPTLQATASGAVQGPKVSYPGATGSDTTVLPEEAGRLDIVLEQPLYHAGARSARARFNAQSALVELEYRKAITSIAAAVQKLYTDAYRAESGVRIASEGVDSALRYQNLVQRLIASGSAKPVDLLTADAQLSEAKAGLSRAEGGARLASFAINQALGRRLDSPLTIAPIDTERRSPASVEEAIAAALMRRTELVELKLELASAHAGVMLARSQAQPTVVARGQLTEQTPSAFLHEHYASAMLEIKLPILDNGKTKLETREAEAQVKRLEALLDQARSGISLDVMRAATQIENAAALVKVTELQVKSATALEIVAETGYQVGRATAFEVQTASREVKLAKEKQADAEIELATARNEYDHAQGSVLPTVDKLAPLPYVPERK